jgi:branched-subunit amino acid transport protein
MALSYKARKRMSLLILLVGLPAYIVAAISLVGLLDRPSVWIELMIYVGLGILWAIPFRFVFRGIGQLDPHMQKAKDDAPLA